jgi:hypothetical protein
VAGHANQRVVRRASLILQVALPGVQTLFGFQVSTVRTGRFSEVTTVSQAVHLASQAWWWSRSLLIAPAAYHHIAASDAAEQPVLRTRSG